jgi:hypothetical protein
MWWMSGSACQMRDHGCFSLSAMSTGWKEANTGAFMQKRRIAFCTKIRLEGSTLDLHERTPKHSLLVFGSVLPQSEFFLFFGDTTLHHTTFNTK